jgi:hypothetical protein
MKATQRLIIQMVIISLTLAAVVLGTLGNDTHPAMAQQSNIIVRVDGVSGVDTKVCGAESAPCKSLQRAVNNVSQNSGATVLVAEGTYTYASGVFSACEALANGKAVLCVYNKQIVLLGGYPHGNWTASDPQNHPTIIDGQGQRRGIYVFTDPSLYAGSFRLVGVVVQNGVATGAASGSVADMSAFGGGLLSDFATVELQRVTFRNNQSRGSTTSQAVGGSGSGGGAAVRSAPSVSLEQVLFTNNQAYGGDGAQRGGFAIGGGLFTYHTIVQGQFITATNNQTFGGQTNGAGLYDGETGDAQGAGIALQINSKVELNAVTVMSNTATGGNAPHGTASGAFGAGMFAEEAQLTLRNSVIQNNIGLGGTGLNPVSTQFRGSLAEGGGLMTDKSNVVLDHVSIIANQAIAGNGSASGYSGAGAGGGAYFNSNPGTPKSIAVVNSVIADNYAAMGTVGTVAGGGGGGIKFYHVQPTIQFSTLARNRLNSTSMQGVAVNGIPESGQFANNIIAEHTSPAGMSAVYIQHEGALNLEHTLWAGNSANLYTGADSGVVTNNTPLNAASAKFVSPGAPNYNYHIKGTSPARDMAVGATVTNDMDFQVRPWPSTPDIGADEYQALVLNGGPAASGKLLLSWWVDSTLLPNVASYEISLVCPAGAACPGALNAGVGHQYVVSGLTNNKTYTLKIVAKDGSNQTLDVSNSVQLTPFEHCVYLPSVIR